ncbi:hypothetical protein GF391_02285 [Candidatus Uhrbacteria bacterium]|nr:hypothetical protein [Candidatus Uhrbacteria bacterium]
MNLQDHPTWELIRLNALAMGWASIIRKETDFHLTCLMLEGISAHYLSLHHFYEHIATSQERRSMLQAGYQPIC